MRSWVHRTGNRGLSVVRWLQAVSLPSPPGRFLTGIGREIVDRTENRFHEGDRQTLRRGSSRFWFSRSSHSKSAVSPPRLCRRAPSLCACAQRHIVGWLAHSPLSPSASPLPRIVDTTVSSLRPRRCSCPATNCISKPFSLRRNTLCFLFGICQQRPWQV